MDEELIEETYYCSNCWEPLEVCTCPTEEPKTEEKKTSFSDEDIPW